MTAKEVTIMVKDVIGGDSALSTDAGIVLFDTMVKAFKNNAKVSLSFKNIKLMTSAFLNAAIGQLYSKYTSEYLNQKLIIKDIQTSDLDTLKLVIERAKDYFKDEEKVSKIIDEEI
ncbi:MAG: STAS-like domain-containing protein [Bacteriovoracaceae bacterium]